MPRFVVRHKKILQREVRQTDAATSLIFRLRGTPTDVASLYIMRNILSVLSFVASNSAIFWPVSSLLVRVTGLAVPTCFRVLSERARCMGCVIVCACVVF